MNLSLLCSACHIAHHAGTLVIRGAADQLVVERPAHATPTPTPAPAGAHVGAVTMLDNTEICEDAQKALNQMGWKPAIARAAVQAAASVVRGDATLERLLVEALRRCPQSHHTTSPARA